MTSKTFDIAGGDDYRIMGEKVTGVNKLIVHTVNTMDGKSPEWRAAAHDLLVALAKDNKYIVSDMVIVFLESAGYGLANYSALGGVFKRAAAAGIIKKIDHTKKSKQALWISTMHDQDQSAATTPVLVRGQQVSFRNFGGVDQMIFTVTDIQGAVVTLEGAK